MLTVFATIQYQYKQLIQCIFHEILTLAADTIMELLSFIFPIHLSASCLDPAMKLNFDPDEVTTSNKCFFGWVMECTVHDSRGMEYSSVFEGN